MKSQAKCVECVTSTPWHTSLCGRPSKEVIVGKALCGIHASALKRRLANEERRHNEYKARRTAQVDIARSIETALRLKQYDVHVSINTDGRVTLSLDTLKTLLKMVEAAQDESNGPQDQSDR